MILLFKCIENKEKMIVCRHEWMQVLQTEEVFYMYDVNSFQIILLLKCIENQ